MNTPTALAIHGRHFNMVKLLLSHKAIITYSDDKSPVCATAMTRDFALVKFLLANYLPGDELVTLPQLIEWGCGGLVVCLSSSSDGAT